MALPPEQENTAHRRAEILDADYVPQAQTPNTPWAQEGLRRRRGVSSVTVVTACIALLALALAVSRGDSFRRTADPSPDPMLYREARWSAAVLDSDAGTPAEEALGAALETLSAPVAAYYSMKDCPRVPGAQICTVEPDGAADAAGLIPGDVITAVNGKAILTAEELSDAICPWNGELLVFTVNRQGETMDVSVGTEYADAES